MVVSGQIVKYFGVIHDVGWGTVGGKFGCHEIHDRCHVAEISAVSGAQIIVALTVGRENESVLRALSVASFFVLAVFTFGGQVKLLTLTKLLLLSAAHELYDAVVVYVAEPEFWKCKMVA